YPTADTSAIGRSADPPTVATERGTAAAVVHGPIPYPGFDRRDEGCGGETRAASGQRGRCPTGTAFPHFALLATPRRSHGNPLADVRRRCHSHRCHSHRPLGGFGVLTARDTEQRPVHLATGPSERGAGHRHRFAAR